MRPKYQRLRSHTLRLSSRPGIESGPSRCRSIVFSFSRSSSPRRETWCSRFEHSGNEQAREETAETAWAHSTSPTTQRYPAISRIGGCFPSDLDFPKILGGGPRRTLLCMGVLSPAGATRTRVWRHLCLQRVHFCLCTLLGPVLRAQDFCYAGFVGAPSSALEQARTGIRTDKADDRAQGDANQLTGARDE